MAKQQVHHQNQQHHEEVKDVIMGFGIIIVLCFSQYLIGFFLKYNNFTLYEYFATCVVSLFAFVGGFELYFKSQRIVMARPRDFINFHCKIDEWIPFIPHAIYLYSFGDLFIMSLIIPTSPNLEYLFRVLFGMLVVTITQCIIFVVFPSNTPDFYRDSIAHYESKNGKLDSITKYFYEKMHKADLNINTIPSGHCSLATYLSLTQLHIFGYWTLLNPLCIAVSCVLTKQHSILDTLVGALFGYFLFILVH